MRNHGGGRSPSNRSNGQYSYPQHHTPPFQYRNQLIHSQSPLQHSQSPQMTFNRQSNLYGTPPQYSLLQNPAMFPPQHQRMPVVPQQSRSANSSPRRSREPRRVSGADIHPFIVSAPQRSDRSNPLIVSNPSTPSHSLSHSQFHALNPMHSITTAPDPNRNSASQPITITNSSSASPVSSPSKPSGMDSQIRFRINGNAARTRKRKRGITEMMKKDTIHSTATSTSTSTSSHRSTHCLESLESPKKKRRRSLSPKNGRYLFTASFIKQCSTAYQEIVDPRIVALERASKSPSAPQPPSKSFKSTKPSKSTSFKSNKSTKSNDPNKSLKSVASPSSKKRKKRKRVKAMTLEDRYHYFHSLIFGAECRLMDSDALIAKWDTILHGLCHSITRKVARIQFEKELTAEISTKQRDSFKKQIQNTSAMIDVYIEKLSDLAVINEKQWFSSNLITFLTAIPSLNTTINTYFATKREHQQEEKMQEADRSANGNGSKNEYGDRFVVKMNTNRVSGKPKPTIYLWSDGFSVCLFWRNCLKFKVFTF